VFIAAGQTHHLHHPPGAMVDEADVRALHRALHARLGPTRARAMAREAGRRTAAYLLRVRIPRFAQWVLKACPPWLASRLLARAIAANAWTFVGSGHFTAHHRRPTRLVVTNCPLCRDQTATEPLCDFYTGTFERLYRELVSRHAHVTEIACCARGDAACVFEIGW
jgi:divinyl protochlorophyllide a 8-vinyl-reductase